MEKNNQQEINMQQMKLIPASERGQLVCSSCGTKLSVKYRLAGNPGKCYCNKCVLQVVGNKSKK